jgi:hydrogenase maturation protease
MEERTLIIGVGNEDRGDDAAGRIVARNLMVRSLHGVTVREHTGEGSSLLDWWTGYNRVIIIDAVSAGTRPGTIFRIDAQADVVPRRFFNSSTHDFGVAEAIELARSLKRLPGTFIVYGIQAKDTAPRSGVSREVARATRETTAMIVNDLSLPSARNQHAASTSRNE